MSVEACNFLSQVFLTISAMAFLACIGASFARNHPSTRPPEEPKDTPECPYCHGALQKGEDGMLSCDCPDCMAAFESNYCHKHKIMYTGYQCPKCRGSEEWA